jgi:hypothetical protein
MAKQIKVRGIPRSEPDVRLYALALIELARQLQAEEQAADESAPARPTSPTETLGGAND